MACLALSPPGFARANSDFVRSRHHHTIISEKHGGQTEPENLAFVCVTCDRGKDSDIASVTEEGALVGLFHPRRHVRERETCTTPGPLASPPK